MDDLIEKIKQTFAGCKTKEQLDAAWNFMDLSIKNRPEIITEEIKKELYACYKAKDKELFPHKDLI